MRWLPTVLIVFIVASLALFNFFHVHQFKLFDIISYDYSQLARGSNGVSASSAAAAASSDADVILFEGASSFLSLLRNEYLKKLTNPPPHCQHNSAQLPNDMEIRRYNRAIEVDWIGRDLSSVEPTWSASDTSSCYFAAMAFPPTEDTLDAALQQKTYISAFHTASQCGYENIKGAFDWDEDKPYTCLGNNFGGTLGAKTQKGCREESIDGYPVKMWNRKNSNGASLQCLKQFLQADEIGQRFDIDVVKLTAANLTNNDNFDRLVQSELNHKDGKKVGSNLDWNTRTFVHWTTMVLLDSVKSNTSDVVDKTIDQLLTSLQDDRNSTFTKCVEELIPHIGVNNALDERQRIWKERGVHLKVSTMADSPSSLLRSLPGSLRGVLPPPPTAVYSVNAILGDVFNVKYEMYYPGCTAWWNAVSTEKQAFTDTNKAGKMAGSAFANLTKTPRILRNEILKSCSSSKDQCPFPTYDLVFDVTQVYCGGFFHWMIEVWPRLAPFLDGLLADDMPDFAIRIGCEDEIQKFHSQFYDLVGLVNISIIGKETVFAKEVIVPTEGFSHSPLLNYWNIVSIRGHVERHLGPIQQSERKTVLVIVRDASRRGDGHIYNEQFLQELTEGLPDHNVVAFRSSDTAMMACLECQARVFMAADVVIGSHGAGLSQILFAKRGGTVLERIVDGGDSGIYAELPFLLGLKYFPMLETAIDAARWRAASASVYRDMILFADSY